MRVDDVRTEAAHDLEQPRERDGVMHGRERTPQRLHFSDGDGDRQEVAHVAFARIQLAVHENRVESARRKAVRQRDRLNRRPADIQSRNDPDNAHRANSIRCDRDWSRAS